MKAKITALFVLFVCFCSNLSAFAQITNVFTGTTPNDHTGDPLYVGFGKLNWNDNYFLAQLAATATAENAWSNGIESSLASLTNDLASVSNSVGAGSSFAGAVSNTLTAGISTVSNRLSVVTNALGVFLATGEMHFDGGLITSDGSGNAGFGRVATTNLLTARLAADVSDPPSVYGLQYLSAATGHVLYRAHNYQSSYEFPAEDYYTWGGNFFSWSFIDGPTATRWGYLNVYENAGQCFFDYEGDSGYPVAVQYDGLLTANQVGVNNGSPAYTLDVGGDINFSGSLWNNGTAIYQPDSLGNGGTTLMLNASDTGTPMYLHVNSSGTLTVTGSP